jgi:hypothetical protein
MDYGRFLSQKEEVLDWLAAGLTGEELRAKLKAKIAETVGCMEKTSCRLSECLRHGVSGVSN